MINNTSTKNDTLDHEWIDLILEAMEIGLSIQEIKDFLNIHED